MLILLSVKGASYLAMCIVSLLKWIDILVNMKTKPLCYMYTVASHPHHEYRTKDSLYMYSWRLSTANQHLTPVLPAMDHMHSVTLNNLLVI